MKCNNCGKEIEGNDNYCEHCGRENIKPKPKKEKKEEKKITREFKRGFTPRLCLEILLYVIAPIGVFLYLVLGTDLARYVALIASLMIPGVVRIRGEDKSSREEFGKSMKGIGIILAVIVGIGLIVFIGWKGFSGLGKILEEKPQTVIAVASVGILIYLIKIYEKKK